jgi:hypothetical protein
VSPTAFIRSGSGPNGSSRIAGVVARVVAGNVGLEVALKIARIAVLVVSRRVAGGVALISLIVARPGLDQGVVGAHALARDDQLLDAPLHFGVHLALQRRARVFLAEHFQQADGTFMRGRQHPVELGEKLRARQGAALQLTKRVNEIFHLALTCPTPKRFTPRLA